MSPWHTTYMSVDTLLSELHACADPIRAQHALRFFKTGKGQYGEGDEFIGITMPALRAICKQHRDLSVQELRTLLQSPIHEHRMAAVVIMSDVFKKKTPSEQQELYELYLEGVRKNYINNWDLVDVSAKNVVGAYLLHRPRDILYTLARSNHLWSKRVAILSTPAFYVKGDPTDTLALAEILLYDSHDLMHKAVGWMLREVGKYVDEALLTEFLDKHAATMPRTTLRYAIERLSTQKKKHYMNLASTQAK